MCIEEKAIMISRYIQECMELKGLTEAKPKDIMDCLIRKGVYERDHRNGKPLREDLRNWIELINSTFAHDISG